MHQRSSLRLLGASVALAAMVAACGGAGSGRLADRMSGGDSPTAPGSSPAAGSPAGDANLGPAPGEPTYGTAPSPRPAATQAISTVEAANLLRQIDDLLRQTDDDLAADSDAATSMGE